MRLIFSGLVAAVFLSACAQQRPAQIPYDSLSDADKDPQKPPVPMYPNDAIKRGLAGKCELRFDVDVDGEPKSITGSCTDAAFCDASLVAMENIRFAPLIVEGRKAERIGVSYPIEFSIDGVDAVSDDAALLDCP